jgi:DNA invertase Pin-like site-specific DNA recombinase
MQRLACREFATRMGWTVGKEFEELGISGSKVSAEKRDAIQDLKESALRGEFQVLLVFMFDRLGRIDDETPFVLEWFVRHGIEVWSVNEGEQKIEQHVDKLMNYIRFWQAAGESEKTSVRTKTALGQMVQEGHFRGGGVAFGFRIEKQGRMNKGNNEVYEILVDEQEAPVVRTIYDLYTIKGYGSQRIATYLREHSIKTRKGENFTNSTISHILGNKSYIGILKSGATESEIFPHLQIIDPSTFEAAQNLKMQRSADYKERCVPLNTKGSSLLSGNVFCGHCGGRLTVTTNGKRYTRKDGSVTETPKTRYTCYKKTRHLGCDGQTGYTVRKLDEIIDAIVRGLFRQLSDVPKDDILEKRYAVQMEESKLQLKTALATHQANSTEVLQYESEVLKIIRCESKLNPELLNKLYEEAKEKAIESDLKVKALEKKIEDCEKKRGSLANQYDSMRSWADLYGDCDMETKKMILSRIMSSIKVSRDYELEIDLTVDCDELGISC